MSARSLTFASLLLGAAQPALAGGYPTQAQSAEASIPEVQSTMPLQAKWNLSIKNGQLNAELILMNMGGDPVDIVSARGHSPGPYVSAILGENTLSPVMTNEQERDMMSRMGPMRSYTAIAQGQQFTAGTFRFTLPTNYGGQTVHLEAQVRGANGDLLKLPLDIVLDAQKAV